MTHQVTKGIVLSRVNFGEADRIIIFLTPDFGKVRVLARGVRKIKSKLAGGIELFSESNITFINGRGEIGTLISTRLQKNYSQIVKDLERTNLGYEILKRINRITEDEAGEEYYDLLQQALNGLDDEKLSKDLIEFWFSMRLLKISGHSPNLKTDTTQNALNGEDQYTFDVESMAFAFNAGASYSANHIKLLRLAIQASRPAKLRQIKQANKQITECLQLANSMLKRFIRV